MIFDYEEKSYFHNTFGYYARFHDYLVTNGITAISGNGMSEADNSFIYTLAGAKVGKNVKALPSGVYIIKGKKVIIR